MRRFGLIGFPLGHSFSQKYFTKKFTDEAIDAVYELFPLERIEDVVNMLDSHPDLAGFNVTIPYKQQIMSYLDEMDEEAAGVGAINVVKVTRENGKRRLKGYNSDIIGFYESIKPLIGINHKHALILGTGGASKAVAAMLSKLNIEYTFVTRTAKAGMLTYDALDEAVMKKYTVIVNASPVGTFPNVDVCPAIPYEFLTPDHLCYDLVYNPAETLFLAKAKAQGATTKNGLQMLELQAEGAWKVWNNQR